MNTIAIWAGLATFASALVDILLFQTTRGYTGWIIAIPSLLLGLGAFLYGMINEPDYTLAQAPMGIRLIAIFNGIAGVVLLGEGILLLFLPIIGILGVILASLGVMFIYVAKAAWNGKEWALNALLILAIIGVLYGIVQLARSAGNPISSIFQLWYLRRPNVQSYFYQTPPPPEMMATKKGPDSALGSGQLFTNMCYSCGAKNPDNAMYCANCTLRMFELPVYTPPEKQLSILEGEITKMDELREAGMVRDQGIFSKSYASRVLQVRKLREMIASAAKTVSGTN